MIKFLKTGKDCFFWDSETGYRSDKYDPQSNLELVVPMIGTTLYIKPEQIKIDYKRDIYFDYDGIHYVVDDGYCNEMIRCGYLIYQDSDKVYTNNKEAGLMKRKNIMSYVKSCTEYLFSLDEIEFNNHEIKITKFDATNQYTIYIDTINSIVNKNQYRKYNNLPYFPFKRNMDKYGTLYVSIFCKKIVEGDNIFDNRYQETDEYIKNLVHLLNFNAPDFHFSPIYIKKRLVDLAS